MPQDWWTRRSLVLTAAAVALASAIGVYATGVSHPEPVARSTLGPDWECTRLAFGRSSSTVVAHRSASGLVAWVLNPSSSMADG